MLGFGGQWIHMRWVGQPLIGVSGQGCRSIYTHGQVKENLLRSPQLLLCFSFYLQRIQPPHLAAIQSSHGLVYIQSEYQWHFYDYRGLNCRKILSICDFEMVQDLPWNYPTLEMLMIWGTGRWMAAVAGILAHIWYDSMQIWWVGTMGRSSCPFGRCLNHWEWSKIEP